jgi:hypothetical protein
MTNEDKKEQNFWKDNRTILLSCTVFCFFSRKYTALGHWLLCCFIIEKQKFRMKGVTLCYA